MNNTLNSFSQGDGVFIEKVGDQLSLSQKVIDILEYQHTEHIYFKVFQTIDIPIIKGQNYKIVTSELNGCTAGFIVFKNSKGVVFVIATHFPPLDGIFENQLKKIEAYINDNFSLLSESKEIEIFLVGEVSRYNMNTVLISSFIEEKLHIVPKNVISYYDRKDKKRAKPEELGILSLELFLNGNRAVIHEGKTIVS